MSKLDILFPIGISFGAVGGPGYLTDVVVLGSGFESRIQRWSQARCMWDVAKACSTTAQVTELISFFRVAKGRLHSFRFRDFTDETVATGEGIVSLISGSTYQLYKSYTNSAGSDSHKIIFPRELVLKAGVTTMTIPTDYTVDLLTGIVTKTGALTPTSWTGKFDRHARFNTDRLELQTEGLPGFLRSQRVMVVEVKD